MAKSSLSKHMPRKVEAALTQMGEQLKLARLRRKLTIEIMAQRCSCTPLTLSKTEKGDPTVSMGVYARYLFALGMESQLTLWGADDPLGHLLQDSELLKRKRAPKRKEL